MAISVNPRTHVIYVPKADLTLIQSTPEVRELDLDAFRLWLKDWEDSEEGVVQLKTHSHNTEVLLSGLNYARIVSVLPPYSVEFEDDQYVINCIGANHNIADVKIPNQVSLIVNNAAGLINNTAIEHASFNGVVLVDVDNGVPGTLYPTGTQQQPSSNLADALLIASFRGFNTFQVQSDLLIDSGNYSNMVFLGSSPTKTNFNISSAANVTGCEFEKLTIQGVLDGRSTIRNCLVGDLTYVNGRILDSGLYGTIVLDGDENAVIADCYTVDQDSPPAIDMGGSGQDLAMPNYSGVITITNLSSDDEEVGIGLDAGQVILDSTITGGTIVVSGIGVLIDNSNGTAVVNTDGLMSKRTITEIDWDTVHLDPDNGTTGTAFPIGTASLPSNNIVHTKAIAEANNIKKIAFCGTVMLTTELEGYNFVGTAAAQNCIIVFTGQSIQNCKFEQCILTGTTALGSEYQAQDCILTGVTGLNCIAVDCGLGGTLTPRPGDLFQAKSCVFVDIPTTIDFNGVDCVAALQIFSGSVVVKNMTDVGDSLAMTLAAGHVEIDSSCTAGIVVNRGHNTLDDFSGAGCVVVNDNYFIDIIKTTWDAIHIDTANGADETIFPAGTPGRPCKTEANLIAIRAANPTIESVHITGSLTLTQAYDSITFYAESETTGALDINGQSVDNSKFVNVYLTGSPASGDHVHYDNCFIPSGMSNVDCHMENCQLAGVFVVDAGGSMETDRCSSPSLATFNCNGDGSLSLANWQGVAAVANVTSPSSTVGITGMYNLTLDASITAGIFQTAGIGLLTDNATSKTLHLDSTLPQAVWEEDLTSGYGAAGSAAYLLNQINTKQDRVLGLVHENSFMDNNVYDGTGRLTSARLRCFDSKINAEAATDGGAETAGLVATYTITSLYDGQNMAEYRMVRE